MDVCSVDMNVKHLHAAAALFTHRQRTSVIKRRLSCREKLSFVFIASPLQSSVFKKSSQNDIFTYYKKLL